MNQKDKQGNQKSYTEIENSSYLTGVENHIFNTMIETGRSVPRLSEIIGNQ